MKPPIEMESRDGCAYLTLNRPHRHNSLVPDLLQGFLAAVRAVGQTQDLKCLVLEGAGRSFSTGGDVLGFLEAGEHRHQYAHDLVGLLNQSILALIDLACPVVVGAQGWITGGSVGFLLAADIVVLSDDARIAPFYTEVGFSPDGGWGTLLSGVIGPRRAAEVQYLNSTVEAARAVEWGLANRSVPLKRLREELGAIAAGICAKRPGSVAATKRLLRGDREIVAAGLERERQAFLEQIGSAEALAGMERFLGI